MVLKKRHSINVEEEGPKKRRKDEACEKPEEKKKSKKGKEYPVKVEKRLSDDEYDEDDTDKGKEDDNAGANPEVQPNLEKDDSYGFGWPKADLIELFNKIEANIPPNDYLTHTTRNENLDWDEVAFNNYTPAECKAVWLQVHKRIRHYRILSEILADARVWVHQPWTHFYRGSKTKTKHPDYPRRPPGVFFLYCQAKKPKILAQNPNLEMHQVTAILGQMYNALPSSKKAKYEKMSEQLNKEYKENVRIFHEQHPEIEPDTKQTITKKTKSGGLVKPPTAKMMFVKDRVEKLQNEPNFIRSEAINNAKLQWDSLSDKKKVVWIKRVAKEEDEYLEKLKLYKADNPDFEIPKMKTALTKEERKLLDRSVGKPDKPPSSGYLLYTRVMLQKCPDLKEMLPKERLKEISVRWTALPEKEKEVYKKKVDYEREQYKADMAAYFESLSEDERKEQLMKLQTLRGAKTSQKLPNNGKSVKSKSKKTNEQEKESVKKVERQYFPGEPHQPPLKAFDLFVESFVSDTKLSASEAPRFWDMLPANDKAKFQRKLTELKEKYIKDYKKFLKSLDEEEVARYNELQKRNKEREAKKGHSSEADDSDEGSSSEEEDEAVNDQNAINDNDSDENNQTENKKSDSSSGSSSSSESSSDSSSSDDSDSSSGDSDDEDANTPQAAVKEEESDSDSSDDD